MEHLVHPLDEAIEFATSIDEMRRGKKARALWLEIYPELSKGHPGMFGAATSRAEAQVMRLSMNYALMDKSKFIGVQHLRAGLAFWKYCEASARYIFGDCLGDPLADRLHKQLRNSPRGLTRTQIRDSFHRNQNAHDIERALGLLMEYGLARLERESGDGGRPTERWFAVGAGNSDKEPKA